ncbi:hypothetical protein FGIG_03885 [Fasciola gigantica]|uniref:Uncharacterized protein n=1 Tax=Fasciola gigantica TaxID=46835 RepID=A0A504YI30_FASGI|nr:hypothetical protein FGIG_03885 [Fasciola gigantica]
MLHYSNTEERVCTDSWTQDTPQPNNRPSTSAHKSEQLPQKAVGIRAKPNFPLTQLLRKVSKGFDELPTIDCMTKLRNVVM